MRHMCFFIALLVAFIATTAEADITERISVAADGTEGDDTSQTPGISEYGQYIVFGSWAGNLVPNDTNGTFDIFVTNTQTGAIERVSVASDGTESNGPSYESNDTGPEISADGRYVAFYSYASNLVADDTNGVGDIFVHDRQTGTTERVSVASDGTQGDGRYSYSPSISADGRFVAFQSWAPNLIDGDTNNAGDILVHDRQTGNTERVSVASDGTEGNDHSYDPSLSADGRYVAFRSIASNLVSDDTNDQGDVFVHDRQTGTTERVSIATDGTQANSYSLFPRISKNDRYVAFYSYASNLVADDTNGVGDIFIHNRQTGTTERVSIASDGTQANGYSYYTDISGDGRFVVFGSTASNLIADDANFVRDIFIHDRNTAATQRISVASDGTEANQSSTFPRISSDGTVVTFESAASNLVPNDTNSQKDVFFHDLGSGDKNDAFWLLILPAILSNGESTE